MMSNPIETLAVMLRIQAWREDLPAIAESGRVPYEIARSRKDQSPQGIGICVCEDGPLEGQCSTAIKFLREHRDTIRRLSDASGEAPILHFGSLLHRDSVGTYVEFSSEFLAVLGELGIRLGSSTYLSSDEIE